jgi:hypothetical protein
LAGHVAIGYFGAGKLPVTMSMEELVADYTQLNEKRELFETSSTEKDLELTKMRARVRTLEEMLHLKGIEG